MTAPPELDRTLALAAAARVRLWPEGGNIHYRSPAPLTPELRELILAHKPALLERLGVWDAAQASRLEWEADELVGELGVPGTDALIVDAARACVEAHHRGDMAGVRRGCALVEERARKLATGLRAAA